jgi:hypothetical protein
VETAVVLFTRDLRVHDNPAREAVRIAGEVVADVSGYAAAAYPSFERPVTLLTLRV